ncbi:synaptic vesicular amine transporter-like isoform X2 [Clavelina lepadiformis]|uniref:synaptic vesicular amine transporter-like isoform X2 n=1 Tax=Clavelina lepadiformis TaxID=159417 RepID=UPI004041BD8A
MHSNEKILMFKVFAVVVVNLAMTINFGLLSMTALVVPKIFQNTPMICDSDLTKASVNGTRLTNATFGLATANVSSAQQVVTPRSSKEAEKYFPFFENFNKTAFYTAKSIFQAFSSVVIGPIIDRFGHKFAMYAGTVFLFITAIGFCLGQSYPLLLLSATIHGIGSSCVTVGGMTMLAKTFNHKKERRNIFELTLASIAASISGGLAVWSLLNPVDYTTNAATFFVIAATITSLGLCQLFHSYLDTKTIKKDKKPIDMWKFPKHFYVLVLEALLLLGLVVGVMFGGFSSWLTCRSFPELISGTGKGFVFLPAFFGFQLTASLVPYSTLSIRYLFPLTIVALGMAITSLGLLAIILSSSLFHILICLLVVGCGCGVVAGFIYPNLAWLVAVSGMSNYGTVYGLADAIICVGFTAGIFAASAVLQASTYVKLMLLSACVCLWYATFLVVLVLSVKRIPSVYKQMLRSRTTNNGDKLLVTTSTATKPIRQEIEINV